MEIQQIEEENGEDLNNVSPNVKVALTSFGSLQRPARHSRASTSNASNLRTSPELSDSGFTNSGQPDHIRRAVSISSLSSLSKILIVN